MRRSRDRRLRRCHRVCSTPGARLQFGEPVNVGGESLDLDRQRRERRRDTRSNVAQERRDLVSPHTAWSHPTRRARQASSGTARHAEIDPEIAQVSANHERFGLLGSPHGATDSIAASSNRKWRHQPPLLIRVALPIASSTVNTGLPGRATFGRRASGRPSHIELRSASDLLRIGRRFEADVSVGLQRSFRSRLSPKEWERERPSDRRREGWRQRRGGAIVRRLGARCDVSSARSWSAERAAGASEAIEHAAIDLAWRVGVGGPAGGERWRGETSTSSPATSEGAAEREPRRRDARP